MYERFVSFISEGNTTVFVCLYCRETNDEVMYQKYRLFHRLDQMDGLISRWMELGLEESQGVMTAIKDMGGVD